MCCPSLWRVSSDFTCPCATHSTRSQLRRPSRIALTASQQTDEFSLTSAALKTRRLQPKREKRRVQSGRGCGRYGVGPQPGECGLDLRRFCWWARRQASRAPYAMTSTGRSKIQEKGVGCGIALAFFLSARSASRRMRDGRPAT